MATLSSVTCTVFLPDFSASVVVTYYLLMAIVFRYFTHREVLLPLQDEKRFCNGK